MSHVNLINLNKSFDKVNVLKNINLEINEGEIISLLGPSGCGKSTTLKIIAGILELDEGDILFDGASVKNIPTGKRDAAIVFQDYLLFPHMNVFENIEFGLKMKKVKKEARVKKVQELVELVKLNDYKSKYPSELSGGQQQRVAIARTLAISPKVLLLDEPFSNLDISLRNEMRDFVLNLQKKLEITTILVTHDKEEALMMSDKVAVMLDGEIKQYDTPSNLYENPNSKEVANIFGDRNYLQGKIKNNKFISNSVELNLKDVKDINNVELMIPQESIKLLNRDSKEGIEGKIIKRKYAGEKTYYDVKVNETILKSSSDNNFYKEGDIIKVEIKTQNIVLF
ncbi:MULTISPECIES: ABC transporter ATP-binding protein [unclassified Romboutsia]|uniref:ABC transporter ATP-binding protein n=1 Tax=unclassified Romboutsia TaxID=2626894 RepID=UPI0008209277|nr:MULTISPECIES: ABC transporter ATP-binding protein [unclassified Romboutsia]SCI19900.1 Spermidine/putrescine import ATP-binding protein PotA [uncultured Clostridium sp.]